MKKAIFILAIAALMLSIISVTAFAYGGHGMRREVQQQPRYVLCMVGGCDVAGSHQHAGFWYCSQIGRQSDYESCPVEGCPKLGLHEHEGKYYRCAYYGPGRGCGRGWNR